MLASNLVWIRDNNMAVLLLRDNYTIIRKKPALNCRFFGYIHGITKIAILQ